MRLVPRYEEIRAFAESHFDDTERELFWRLEHELPSPAGMTPDDSTLTEEDYGIT